MKSLIKILTACYIALLAPFVLRILYGIWIFEKSYVDWGLGAIAILSYFFGLAAVLISLKERL